jgi:hypothetical protein
MATWLFLSRIMIRGIYNKRPANDPAVEETDNGNPVGLSGWAWKTAHYFKPVCSIYYTLAGYLLFGEFCAL